MCAHAKANVMTFEVKATTLKAKAKTYKSKTKA